jgi:6-phosphogluconolactonase
MNIRKIFALALCAVLAAVAVQTRLEAATLVYIATRATPQAATGPQGIYAARLDTATGKLESLGLQIELSRISWLAPHPARPILFMVANPDGSTTVESALYSYAVDKRSGKLRQLGQTGTGGRDTTHLDFDAKSSTLFGASFASGEVTAVQVSPDGSLGKVVSGQKHSGTGPRPRQTMPHAHAAVIDPTRRFVLSADLGADRIFVHRFDAKTRALTPAQPPFEAVPPGSGPRHLVFHPNGRFLYLVTEMSADVLAYGWDGRQGRLSPIEAHPGYPAGYAGDEKSAAEITIARDGRHLYVSLRGDQDSIVVYEVNAKTGGLTEIQRLPSQGKSPRTFGIDPSGRWLLVANESTSMVNVFGIDKATGRLTAGNVSLAIPNPASLAFYPD